MQSRSETLTATNGATVEVGTVVHEGREFAAQGSVIDEQTGVIVGYPKGDRLQTWGGKDIEGLKLRVVSTWSVRSWIGSTMYAYSAVYNGRKYHGRGFGDGMSLVLRANKGC